MSAGISVLNTGEEVMNLIITSAGTEAMKQTVRDLEKQIQTTNSSTNEENTLID